MTDDKKMMRFAVPNKGALSEKAVELLESAGYRCKRSGRELSVCDTENSINFFFLRPRDIALYIGQGIIDAGITGRDLAIDSGAETAELMDLEFGKSRFCFAAPRGRYTDISQLSGCRIATSYPVLLKKIMADLGISGTAVKLDGAVEISVQLGVADAIADVVESGSTLRAAGLETVGEPLLHSSALLIGHCKEQLESPEIKRMTARLRGMIVAKNYAMIEYDIPREKLETACRITPGLEAPTVSPLSNPSWVAIKAMVERNSANRIMDELYAAGARGIVITGIQSCRL